MVHFTLKEPALGLACVHDKESLGSVAHSASSAWALFPGVALSKGCFSSIGHLDPLRVR
jgi:hypothetical protein